MANQWYYALLGQQYGPVPEEELRNLVSGGQLLPGDVVWTEGMTEWAPASQVKGLFPGPPPVPPSGDLPGSSGHVDLPADVNSKRITAGVMGILFGSIGVHKFVLGFTGPGLIMLLSTVLTCGFATFVTYPIGLIEGIIYLAASDQEFYEMYMVQ
jgi:TM2 domain-containing membrane protein YozV